MIKLVKIVTSRAGFSIPESKDEMLKVNKENGLVRTSPRLKTPDFAEMRALNALRFTPACFRSKRTKGDMRKRNTTTAKIEFLEKLLTASFSFLIFFRESNQKIPRVGNKRKPR